jgi:hypothetical protein
MEASPYSGYTIDDTRREIPRHRCLGIGSQQPVHHWVTTLITDMFRTGPQRDDLRTFLMSPECAEVALMVANLA